MNVRFAPMKKRIILLRHAKTESFNFSKSDFERDLTEKGISDSRIISNILKEKGFVAEYIISSPANRAKQTATLFAETFGVENIQFEEEIYDVLLLPRFFELIANVSEEFHTVLLVGHNPDIFNIAYNFIDEYLPQVPPCCAIVFKTSCDKWNELSDDSLTLETIEKPQ